MKTLVRHSTARACRHLGKWDRPHLLMLELAVVYMLWIVVNFVASLVTNIL